MDGQIADFKHFAVACKGSRNTTDSPTPDTKSIPVATELATEPGKETDVSLEEVSMGHWESYCSNGLEGLPPEVRRHILSVLGLPQLKMLVRASPTFYQQYFHDRRYLLCRCLEETLGSVTVDAYAVNLFATQVGNKNRNITGFLRSYSESTAGRRLSLVDRLSQDKAISMAAFYFRYVEPMTESFVRWILQNLHKAPGPNLDKPAVTNSLTNTELTRFTRAIYRFQMLCHLGDSDDKDIRLWREDNVQAFLEILEPWEREELYSFYQFAEDTYDHIFNDIRWDLHPDNPKFDDQGRPPTPDGAFDLSISSRHILPLQHISNYDSLSLLMLEKQIEEAF